MPVNAPNNNLDMIAPSFNLINIDDNYINLQNSKGDNGTVIVFICNHCPYVKAVVKDIVNDVINLKGLGVETIAIMSNDTINFPDDSFDNMIKFSKINNFNFPYLIDETQDVAKKYGAVCTPDFFGYNNKLELNYRGRIKELKNLKPVNTEESDLLSAMKMIVKTGSGPKKQIPSMGCNIKWVK